MKDIYKQPIFQNVVVFAVLSFLQSLQLLIIAAVTFSFIPFKKTDFVNKIFPVYLPEVRPEREMLLFRLFVIFAIAIMSLWVWRYKKNMEEPGLAKKFYAYASFIGLCILAQIFFVFKILLWGAPLWAKVMLYLTTLITIGGHIFWPEIRQIASRVQQWLTFKKLPYAWAWDAVFVGGLLLLLWPSKIDYVLARIFIKDQFYHLDSLIMAPGFAYLKGLVLNQDITSQYSIAIPVIFASALNLFQQFDYVGVVTLVIALSLAYYMSLYFFISHWLSSRAVAVFGTLLAVKLQMFHWGVAPLVWQFPSATTLRHLPDIIFFYVFWQYLQTGKKQWFVAMVAVVGFSLFWMIDVGVYLLAALSAYLLLTQWQKLFVVIPIALAIAFGLLAIIYPQAVFNLSFWQHQFEFAGLFMQGWGALPITEGLKDKQYFAFIIGLIIPMLYVANMLVSTAQFWLDKKKTDRLFLMVLSIYGLGLYHYFIHRSGVTSYYAVCIPLVLILCFWLKHVVDMYLSQNWRRPSLVFAGVIMLPVLLSSYFFTFYPNVLNLGQLDWRMEAKYYKERFNFKQDAALISRLTQSNENVALISSFETKILMQAQRKSFFYYSPLVESSLMDDTKSRLTYLHTKDRLTKTLNQIKTDKPKYIFIEKKMLIQKGQTGLSALLDGINAHFVADAQGQYLIAYKRKGL